MAFAAQQSLRRFPPVLDLLITLCLFALAAINFGDVQHPHHVLRETFTIAAAVFCAARLLKGRRSAR